MPEKFHWQDKERLGCRSISLTHKFLVEAIVKAGCTHLINKHNATDGFDVKLTVNGFEIPFKDTLDSMFECYDEDTARKAAELVSEKFNSLSDVLYELKEKVEYELSKTDQ